MRKVTAEEVRQSCIKNQITRVISHDCSLCGVPVGYSIRGDEILFHPQCGCSSGYYPPEPRTWQDLSDWINMQSNEKAWDEIAGRFSFKPEESNETNP